MLPEDHLALLDNYMSIAPHLMPSDFQSVLNRPTLRHPGTHSANVPVHVLGRLTEC